MDATAARPIPNQQPIRTLDFAQSSVTSDVAPRRKLGKLCRTSLEATTGKPSRREGTTDVPIGYSRFAYSEALRLVRRRFERDPDLHLVRLADSRDSEIG